MQAGDIVKVTESNGGNTFRGWRAYGDDPLVKEPKTAIISMPEMNRFTTDTAGTTAKGDFFYSFNHAGSLTSLPAGSFDTSNITTVGNNFFANFNPNGALTSLPAGSFNTSNITTLGSSFFVNFNYSGKLTQGNNSISIKNITSSAKTFYYWTDTTSATQSVPAGGTMTYNGM